MKSGKSFIDIVNEHLASKETLLPVFDKTVLRIQQELAKKEPDVSLIEKLIVRDPSLTSQVLRIANSAFYRGLQKVSTIRNAITRVGIREVSNIALLVTHRKSFHSKDPFFREFLGKLWRHSVGCAIGASWLAKHCGFHALSNEAFIAGLLHDVGKLFLLTVIESIVVSEKKDFKPSVTLLTEVMDTLHTEHGYTLLKNWNLPDMYCVVARDHHLEKIYESNSLLIMIRLVNKACNMMGIGLRQDPSIILAATTEADLLGVSEILLAELEITLEDSLVFDK